MMYRFTPKRKLDIINAIKKEPDRREALLTEFGISNEEYRAWCLVYTLAGLQGLRVTKRVNNVKQSLSQDQEPKALDDA